MIDRTALVKALAKPLPQERNCLGSEEFDPWEDVIKGIHGSYAGESDRLMIAALEAVREGTTREFITERGFAGEFAFYVLSGHGLIDYGVSPRHGWPMSEIADLWEPLIVKWKAYAEIMWS